MHTNNVFELVSIDAVKRSHNSQGNTVTETIGKIFVFPYGKL